MPSKRRASSRVKGLLKVLSDWELVWVLPLAILVMSASLLAVVSLEIARIERVILPLWLVEGILLYVLAEYIYRHAE